MPSKIKRKSESKSKKIQSVKKSSGDPMPKIYWVGGIFDGLLVFSKNGPQAAADLYRTETGDKKSVEVYELLQLGNFKGKKVKGKSVVKSKDFSIYSNEDLDLEEDGRLTEALADAQPLPKSKGKSKGKKVKKAKKRLEKKPKYKSRRPIAHYSDLNSAHKNWSISKTSCWFL